MKRLFPDRKYKSGSKWSLWRWTDTPSGYITRLHLVQTPVGSVMLHWINGPDPEPHLHDHPVTFLSLILRGGYTEEVEVVYQQDYWTRTKHVKHVRRWFNFIRAGSHVHRIVSVKPNTLTLCFMSRKTREWGFHTEEGWIYWRVYNLLQYDSERWQRRARERAAGLPDGARPHECVCKGMLQQDRCQAYCTTVALLCKAATVRRVELSA